MDVDEERRGLSAALRSPVKRMNCPTSAAVQWARKRQQRVAETLRPVIASKYLSFVPEPMTSQVLSFLFCHHVHARASSLSLKVVSPIDTNTGSCALIWRGPLLETRLNALHLAAQLHLTRHP